MLRQQRLAILNMYGWSPWSEVAGVRNAGRSVLGGPTTGVSGEIPSDGTGRLVLSVVLRRVGPLNVGAGVVAAVVMVLPVSIFYFKGV